MDIQFKYADHVEAEELFVLMRNMESATGDRFPARDVFHYALRDLDKERKALENCVSVTARTEEGKLVGYMRIITDHVYLYYFLDLMVDPAVRGLGIGKKIMSLATETCKEGGFIKILFTAIPDKLKFHKSFGYKETMSPVLALRGEDYV